MYNSGFNENSVQGSVYFALKQRIMNLKLTPGTTMSAQEIATIFNVSRTPVREAFIRLEREGLVEILPQKGTTVSKIDLNRVKEERFIRESLEIAVLDPFFEKCEQKHIDKLNAIIEEQKNMFKQKDCPGFLKQDYVFHRLLFEVSDLLLGWETIENVNGHYNRIRLLTVWEDDIFSEAIKQHEDIVEAFIHKDITKAKKVLGYHLSKLITEEERFISQYPEFFKSNHENELDSLYRID